MFGELPKLLGREFAIGYFLPVCALALGAYVALGDFGYAEGVRELLPKDLLIGASVALATIWLLSLAFMAVNRAIIRLLEGYGRLNPMRLVRFLQYRSFDRLQARIETLSATARGEPGAPPASPESERERARLEAQFARGFPSRRDMVLATAFGNAIRAFEDYARVIYGFDAIEGWDRLLAIVPESYRALIDSAKTKVDLAVNVWLAALFLALAYALMAGVCARLPNVWYPLAALGVAWLAARSAKASAYEWGVTIKAAIDAFLPELAAQMGYRLPRKAADQKKFWTLLSQTFLFREPRAYADLDRYRAAEARPNAGKNASRTPKKR